MKDRRVVIYGGGTFTDIRNHFSFAARAKGSTAKYLHSKMKGSELILTSMANVNSNIVTNADVEESIDSILEDKTVKVIIFSCAIADFTAKIDNVEPNSKSERLKSSKEYTIDLLKTEKIINKIRRNRKDIFLVGFKTETDVEEDVLYKRALKMLKTNRCNLVFANDTVRRKNMIVCPEESYYHYSDDRIMVLNDLISMIEERSNLTYNGTFLNNCEKSVRCGNYIVTDSLNYDMKNTSKTFQTVMRYLLDNNAYTLNDNGFTTGHFCERIDDYSMFSSMRKKDHNNIFKEGICRVEFDSFNVKKMLQGKKTVISVYGQHKASVGAMSQMLLFYKNPEYDCIVHFHNTIKDKFKKDASIVPQKPYQCGSLECGLNTCNGLTEVSFGGIKIKYVMLDKHGPNILFKSKDDPMKIISFIENHFNLGEKTK